MPGNHAKWHLLFEVWVSLFLSNRKKLKSLIIRGNDALASAKIFTMNTCAYISTYVGDYNIEGKEKAVSWTGETYSKNTNYDVIYILETYWT